MKTVLITGASRGIGAEIARTFASQKYNVVINLITKVKNKQCVWQKSWKNQLVYFA